MTFRVYIQPDLALRGLRVWLVERYADKQLFYTSDPLRRTIEVAQYSAPPDDAYFAQIPIGAEHALLGELARQLGAVEHPEQLRRDFEHVRGRYDLVVDALLDQVKNHPRSKP